MDPNFLCPTGALVKAAKGGACVYMFIRVCVCHDFSTSVIQRIVL